MATVSSSRRPCGAVSAEGLATMFRPLQAVVWSKPLYGLAPGTGSRKQAAPSDAHAVEQHLVLDDLVHGTRGLGAAGFADHAGRDAGHGGVARHGFQHHGTGRHAGALADLDVAEDLGAGADQHALAHLGMAV